MSVHSCVASLKTEFTVVLKTQTHYVDTILAKNLPLSLFI